LLAGGNGAGSAGGGPFDTPASSSLAIVVDIAAKGAEKQISAKKYHETASCWDDQMIGW
jgi:hypothetical protein